MTAANLFDHLGRPLTLGPKLGGGGEGTVFNLANFPDLAAKVYDKPKRPPPHQEAKLRAMIALTRKELCAIAAWPTATLHEKPGGRFCGFVMGKVPDLREVHFLYSPAHRKVTFPDADWRFLVHTAMNCAAAFDTVHGCGVVIGDVNQGNVSVSADGRVTLLDCDSYKVHLNGRNYPASEMGIDLFTPPELQGRSFEGVDRTANHDRFGLAVLIFYLLFMNRHPYAGYVGPGDMPLGRAIRECRFAYGRAARACQMKTPPGALPLSAVSPQLADLFERAFGPGSVHANARPAPSEWEKCAKAFLGSLRSCAADLGHVYPPHLPGCPWCGLMRQGAANLFITVAYARAAASPAGVSFVLSAVWARIEQVPRPTTAYVRPAMPPAATPTPWPAGLARTVPPQPIAPSILTSPPVPPVTSRVGRTVPAKPIPPPILTSPPPVPAMIVPPPKRRREVVQPDSAQRIVGITAAVCGSGFIPVGVCAMLVGVVALGPVGVGAGFLGVVVFAGFVVFGIWWLILEWVRRGEEHELNQEYDEELARLRAEARRQRKQWESQLAAQKAEAQRRYAEEIFRWESAVAALHAEARREQERWEAQLAAQQAEARRRYQDAVRHWQSAVAAVRDEAERRRRAASDARQRAEAAEHNWVGAAARLMSEFDKKKADLRRLRDRHNELAGQHATEQQRLQASAREMQLSQFLQQKFISVDEKIPGIGPGRTATLASYSIETAGDIVADQILEVPGFGLELTRRLVQWRQTVESQFVFNAAAGVPPQEQQKLFLKYAPARQQIEAALLSGDRELKGIAAGAENELRQLYEHIKSSLRHLAQADSDLAVIPPGL